MAATENNYVEGQTGLRKPTETDQQNCIGDVLKGKPWRSKQCGKHLTSPIDHGEGCAGSPKKCGARACKNPRRFQRKGGRSTPVQQTSGPQRENDPALKEGEKRGRPDFEKKLSERAPRGGAPLYRINRKNGLTITRKRGACMTTGQCEGGSVTQKVTSLWVVPSGEGKTAAVAEGTLGTVRIANPQKEKQNERREKER